MRRRQVLAAIGAGAIGVTLAPHAFAQKTVRIGFLASSQPTPEMLSALRDGLRTYGYLEGQNLSIDVRWPQGTFEQIPGFAAELVNANVDVIIAWASPATAAARRATSTIPIVMVGVADPVESGFIANLARPGGNITGVRNMASDLTGKQVQLLVELVPGITRIIVLGNPDNPVSAILLRYAEGAGRSMGLPLQVVEVRVAEDFERAFVRGFGDGAKAMVVLTDPLFITERHRIAKLANMAGLATSFGRRENVDAGGLLSYGPNLLDQIRQTATYVDRILKGAKPADLPVEQPTRFELVINLKTAKALGITVPPTILLRADEVIE